MSAENKIPECVRRYESDPFGFFDASEYYDIADYYESVIDPDAAFRVLMKGIEAYSDDPSLQLELSHLYIVTGNFDKAESLLLSLKNSTIIKEPEDRLALSILQIKLQIELEQFTALEKSISEIHLWYHGNTHEDFIDSITDITSALFLAFLYKYAKQVLEIGIEYCPKEVSFYETLIECCMKETPDFKEGIKYAEKAIDIDPYNSRIWCKLGYLQRYDDNLIEAVKAFDYATSIDEHNLDAWKAMAECHSKMENYDKAAECYIKAIDRKKSDVALLVNIGDAYNNCDKYPEAREYYRKALDIDGSNDEALFGVGMSYFLDIDQNPTNFSMAIYWIKRALNENDTNSVYWSILAECFFSIDKYGYCIYAINRSLQINPNQPDLLSKLGQTYLLMGEYEEAVSTLGKAKKQNSSDSIINLTLAIAYYKLGNQAQAKYYLMRAMEKKPAVAKDFLDFIPEGGQLVADVKKLL